jgi:DNA-binding transcriptional MerR regulator
VPPIDSDTFHCHYAVMSTRDVSSTTSSFTLADLSRLADVTARTVRYYVALGLLPSPGQAGPGARYPESALSRLRLIRELQRNHLPLAEIRARLAGLSDVEVAGLLAPPSPAPPDTALDYIRGVLGAARRAEPVPATRLFSSVAAPAPARSMAPGSAPAGPEGPQAMPGAARAGEPASEPAPPARSQWDRIALSPDIEIHIRRPLGRLEQRRVERLIAIARQVLKEDTP